jgi:ABC-type cobalamin/Fe3+-siderophores transport system ATPase subunit
MEEIIFENVTLKYPRTGAVIFENLSLRLSEGITTFVGQNGTGKSTLLLLAAGSLLPTEGHVYIQGVDTAELRDEHKRQRYVSVIFQNMEFETQEDVGTLLHYVYEHGFYERQEAGVLEKLIDVFELEPYLKNKTQELSKGELQRTILAFSLLYGSRIIVMDEPIFAMEDYQKHRAMKFMTEFARERKLSMYFSVHELDISQKYSDYTLLFRKDASPIYGLTSKVLTREHLEKAYEVPLTFLKQKETLYRKALQEEEVKKEDIRKHFTN